MAKRAGGRPKKLVDDGGTKHIRVYADLAEMIREIAQVEDVSMASLLDPIIRPSIAMRYERIRPQLEKIKKAAQSMEKARAEASEKLKD